MASALRLAHYALHNLNRVRSTFFDPSLLPSRIPLKLPNDFRLIADRPAELDELRRPLQRSPLPDHAHGNVEHVRHLLFGDERFVFTDQFRFLRRHYT